MADAASLKFEVLIETAKSGAVRHVVRAPDVATARARVQRAYVGGTILSVRRCGAEAAA